jgi:hypothetical protein
MPREKDPIEPPLELPRSEVIRMPLAYQKILLKPLMPKRIADKIMVGNRKFRARALATGSTKPISKIVE